MSRLKITCPGWSSFLLIVGVLLLLACGGSAQQKSSNGGFASRVATGAVEPDTTPGLSAITLSPATVVGGNAVKLKVTLTQAAPAGGLQVTLSSANPAQVTAPASVTIAKGHTQASAELATVAVTASTSVALTASYNNATAGATLTLNPAKEPSFTLRLQPTALSLDPGSAGSDQLVTEAGTNFDNALTLDAPNPPAGVSVSFTPSVIAAPGSGTAQVSVNVDSNVAAGKYPIKITASDGSITRTATLRLTVGNGSSTGPVGPIIGCTLQMNGHKYQAVTFTMNESATVDFNATLYFGATCDPNRWADQFGFGQSLTLDVGYIYTFWFSDFADQLNTSAIWQLGSQSSQCVDYSVAPDC